MEVSKQRSNDMKSAIAQRYEDLYSKNVLYSAPAVSQLSEDEIMRSLGKPVTGRVRMKDSQSTSPSMPPYLVRPVSIRGDDREVRIADFGNGKYSNLPKGFSHY